MALYILSCLLVQSETRFGEERWLVCLESGGESHPRVEVEKRIPISLEDSTVLMECPGRTFESEPVPAAFNTAAMPRSEIWNVDFTFDIHATEWAMFGARKTISANGKNWKLNVDDALGGGMYLAARLTPFSLETYFDYDFAVLTTADQLSLRTWGANIGFDLLGNDWQRLTLLMGPSLTYSHVKFSENGRSIPGRLQPTAGGELGVRLTKDISEGRIGIPTIGFSADMFLRYSPLRFEGDWGVQNEKIGGWGLVVSLGGYLKF